MVLAKGLDHRGSDDGRTLGAEAVAEPVHRARYQIGRDVGGETRRDEPGPVVLADEERAHPAGDGGEEHQAGDRPGMLDDGAPGDARRAASHVAATYPAAAREGSTRTPVAWSRASAPSRWAWMAVTMDERWNGDTCPPLNQSDSGRSQCSQSRRACHASVMPSARAATMKTRARGTASRCDSGECARYASRSSATVSGGWSPARPLRLSGKSRDGRSARQTAGTIGTTNASSVSQDASSDAT